jgi:hypothetical protein
VSSSVIIILIPIQCFAFLDFIGEKAAKFAETAVYTDAVAEMLGEVTNDSGIQDGAKEIRRMSQQIKRDMGELQSIGASTKSILEGPDWSSKRLDANIRSTTDYIRRVKRLLSRITFLGAEGATAFNTAETNFALNEIQKNQQAMILQLEDQKLRNLERETQENKRWNSFTQKQRAYRYQRKVEDGKLK